MNTHVSAFPLAGMATAMRINTGFRALGVQLCGPNQPFIFVEHAPDQPTEVWEILAIPSGGAFPPESHYVGTFPVLTEHKNYIAVAGSAGMQDQPKVQVNIMHAYIRPCPLDAIPTELMDAAA